MAYSYGTKLQKDASELFQDYTAKMSICEKYSFEIIIGDDGVKKVNCDDEVTNLEKIENILYEMVDQWYEYDEKYDADDGWDDDVEYEKYMIFDMDEYYVFQDFDSRNWIYEYEIVDFYKLILKKLKEYNSLVKIIENELEKIQLEKDVCAGISLAFLLMA
jgi:hypothetical protein